MENKTISKNAIPEIKTFINDRKITTIAIGPGLSSSSGARSLIRFLIEEMKLPIVLDADALTSLSEEKNLKFLKDSKTPAILTPHPGEMARLIKKDTSYIRENVISVAEEFASRYKVILVLKGAPTVIASPEGRIFINSTGNPGLAKGGSGDVLTGMIAAFIHQVKDPLKAAILGVYLHGLAADICSEEYGELSMNATDLIESISLAMDSSGIS